MKVIKSCYNSKCGLCGRDIRINDKISPWKGGWYHTECVQNPIETYIESIKAGRIFFTMKYLRHPEYAPTYEVYTIVPLLSEEKKKELENFLKERR